MKVVCNSSPLIALLSVDKITILDKLFSEVYIPKAVYDEVFAVKHKYADFGKADFLNKISVTDNDIIKVLNVHLGLGESEVIALSIEKKLDGAILDDKQARNIADNMGLKVLGTVGVLMLAKQRKIISNVKPLLIEMKKKVNFRLSSSIIDKIND